MTPAELHERRRYLIRCSYFMRGNTAAIASVLRQMGFAAVTPQEILRTWGDEIANDNPLFCQARPEDGFPATPECIGLMKLAVRAMAA